MYCPAIDISASCEIPVVIIILLAKMMRAAKSIVNYARRFTTEM
jgi:hypothetical protein